MTNVIILAVLSLCSVHASSTFDFRGGEVVMGLPGCIKKYNQLYCSGPGTQYPQNQIGRFITDNLALMRRMYGQVEAAQLNPSRTPASTTLFQPRMVRQFRGGRLVRFKRDVDQGYIEDMIVEEEDEYEKYAEYENGTEPYDHKRPKRQAQLPRTDKKDNKIDACDSRTELTTPYWATNHNNEVRAIVNTKELPQSIHQEICGNTATIRCAGDCQCEQKYKWHRLLAYDPNNDCAGIFMDWFLFPSCCACRCKKNPLIDRA